MSLLSFTSEKGSDVQLRAAAMSYDNGVRRLGVVVRVENSHKERSYTIFYTPRDLRNVRDRFLLTEIYVLEIVELLEKRMGVI